MLALLVEINSKLNFIIEEQRGRALDLIVWMVNKIGETLPQQAKLALTVIKKDLKVEECELPEEINETFVSSIGLSLVRESKQFIFSEGTPLKWQEHVKEIEEEKYLGVQSDKEAAVGNTISNKELPAEYIAKKKKEYENQLASFLEDDDYEVELTEE